MNGYELSSGCQIFWENNLVTKFSLLVSFLEFSVLRFECFALMVPMCERKQIWCCVMREISGNEFNRIVWERYDTSWHPNWLSIPGSWKPNSCMNPPCHPDPSCLCVILLTSQQSRLKTRLLGGRYEITSLFSQNIFSVPCQPYFQGVEQKVSLHKPVMM